MELLALIFHYLLGTVLTFFAIAWPVTLLGPVIFNRIPKEIDRDRKIMW